MRLAFFTLLFTFFAQSLFSQEKLFRYNGMYHAPNEIVSKGTKLKLDRSVLNQLFAQQHETVSIQLPIENATVVLNLSRTNLFSKNFRVFESATLKEVDFTPGYHLRGRIEGEENSFAAISIFQNHMGGVISYRGMNYNIVIANNYSDVFTNDYLIYADADFHDSMPACETPDSDVPIVIDENLARSTHPGCPVDMYFETAYDMFQRLGNTQAVMDYFTLLFNSVQTLYSNEDIQMQLREVKVWNTPEPEAAFPNVSDIFYSFQARMWLFNGDLAHFVSFRNGGGGLAALDVLCNPGRQIGVSCNLNRNYPPFPNYSFSIMVVTHEIGHNIGSPHTHNCGWPGGAIDDCYPTEGGCASGPAPVNGGTIMSYCHQRFSTGINFANGFGPLPGNLIRSKVMSASSGGAFSCICDCEELEIDINAYDIGCANSTGAAKVVITGGTGPFTYDWSNGATGDSISGLTEGHYYVTVTGASPDCKVIRYFRIDEIGNATNVELSPADAQVQKCLDESYTLTATANPPGAYTYQWHNSAGPIPGATNASYTISSSLPGASNYYVTATAAPCFGQSPTVNVSFQPVPVPLITPSGSVAICDGATVNLVSSATSLQVQWLRNGTPIPGATGLTFEASLAGSYTVKHFSSTASCEEISSPVVVSIQTAPSVSIQPAALAICQGEQGILSVDSVPGVTYVWYRNAAALSLQTNATLQVQTAGSYTVKARGANGCESVSLPAVVTVNSLPDVALSPSGNILLCDGGTIRLSVSSLSNAQFNWYKGTTMLPQHTSSINITESGSYSVHVVDYATGCENISSATNVTLTPPPSIFAGNDTIVATGQPVRLLVKVQSAVQPSSFEWTPATGLNNPFSYSPVARLQHDQEYTVRAVFPSGCSATDNVMIKVMKGPALYVPSAFTPNGDGVNDVLRVIGVGIKSFVRFSIYNRFGQQVFHTTDINKGWNGRLKGAPVETASFVYVAEAIDFNGKPINVKGVVTLVR